jgi:hypothetical protein
MASNQSEDGPIFEIRQKDSSVGLLEVKEELEWCCKVVGGVGRS